MTKPPPPMTAPEAVLVFATYLASLDPPIKVGVKDGKPCIDPLAEHVRSFLIVNRMELPDEEDLDRHYHVPAQPKT